MNLFEVNNKDTRATSFDDFIDFILRVFIINFEHILHIALLFSFWLLQWLSPPFSLLLSLVKYNKINFSSIYNKWNFCTSYAPLSRCFVYYFIFQIWNSKKLMNATFVMGLNVCKSTNFFSKVSVVATKLKIFHKYLNRNIKLGI